MKKLLTFLFINSFLLVFAKPTYVTSTLMGQLGNQMFQIAAALNISYETGAIAVFPDLIKSQNYDIPLNYKNVFSHLNTNCEDKHFLTYRESTFHYSPIPHNKKRNIKLFGYFNSEKYFAKHKEKIIQAFQPSKEIETFLNENYKHIIHHPKTVAVHIRTFHKDLQKNPNIYSFHPFVGWDYIKKAMNYFDDSYLFLVFSDDIPFVKEEMEKLDLIKDNIKFIEGNSHYHDLYLMSFCKHNIISNSTFSWWAAYLNKNNNKIVIAPQKWLGEAYRTKNTKDVIPVSWTVIQN